MPRQPLPQPFLTQRNWPQRWPEKAPRWCSLDPAAMQRRAALPARLSLVQRLAAAGVHTVELGDPVAHEADRVLCREVVAALRGRESPALQVRISPGASALAHALQALSGATHVVLHWQPGVDEDVEAGMRWLRAAADGCTGTSMRTLRLSAPGLQRPDTAGAQRVCRAVEQAWQPDESHPAILNLAPSPVPLWPHVYADLVEQLVALAPAGVRVSVSPSNHLGMAVASAAQALLAGAWEVQGSLLADPALTDLSALARGLHAAGVMPRLGTLDEAGVAAVPGSGAEAGGDRGAAAVLQRHFGLSLPPALRREFARSADATGAGDTADAQALWRLFKREYMTPAGPLTCGDYDLVREDGHLRLLAGFVYRSRPVAAEGRGLGPLAAFVDAVNRALGLAVRMVDFSEHALDEGEAAEAVAYVRLRLGSAHPVYGCAVNRDITAASLQAAVAAVNRALQASEGG